MWWNTIQDPPHLDAPQTYSRLKFNSLNKSRADPSNKGRIKTDFEFSRLDYQSFKKVPRDILPGLYVTVAVLCSLRNSHRPQKQLPID